MSDVERLAEDIMQELELVSSQDGVTEWVFRGERFWPEALAADLIGAGWTRPPTLQQFAEATPEGRAYYEQLREQLRDHEARHRETIYGRLEVALEERDRARAIAVALEQELAALTEADGFYEDDEPIADLLAEYDAGTPVVTVKPGGTE